MYISSWAPGVCTLDSGDQIQCYNIAIIARLHYESIFVTSCSGGVQQALLTTYICMSCRVHVHLHLYS